MKKSILLILIVLNTGIARGQSPVQSGEKITYIDSNGKVVNEGMFKRGTAFSDGLAAVDVAAEGNKPKWFFISTDFSIAIPYGYDTVGLFVDGFCPVKKDGYWIYIGQNGLIRIDAKFTEAGNFYGGKARVKDESGVYLIDTAGTRLTPAQVEDISTWNHTVFGARLKSDTYWVLMDFNGKILLNDSFYGVWPSDNGFTCVNRLGGYRFLDANGKLLFGKAYMEAGPFCQGWASIRMENDWFLINERGTIKKDLRMKSSVRMYGNLTPAINYNGKAGLLDREGNWVYRLP